MSVEKTFVGDEDIDAFVDDMLSTFEKAGKTYEECAKAMQLAIDRAREPLTIAQWIEFAKLDPVGRRKYADNLFEAVAVKKVVVDLVKKKSVYRLGRQTFFSHVIVGEMGTAIDNVMLWNCCVCGIDEMAEMLTEYEKCAAVIPMKKKHIRPPLKVVTIQKTNTKMKNFVEEKIVRLALDDLDSVVKNGDEYFHITTPEVCANYAKGAMSGRTIREMPVLDFFEMVNRVHFTGMDNQFEGRNISHVKAALGENVIRKIVLGLLEKDKIIVATDDTVFPCKKDKYLWLDE